MAMNWRSDPGRTIKKPRERLRVDARKRMLLDLALPLAEIHGFERVTRDMLADAAGVSGPLISRYWHAREFQNALMEAAVLRENAVIVAQGLAVRHPAALAAPLVLRQAAAATLVVESP
jgi:AcrR family transcriptional regulator